MPTKNLIQTLLNKLKKSFLVVLIFFEENLQIIENIAKNCKISYKELG